MCHGKAKNEKQLFDFRVLMMYKYNNSTSIRFCQFYVNNFNISLQILHYFYRSLLAIGLNNELLLISNLLLTFERKINTTTNFTSFEYD